MLPTSERVVPASASARREAERAAKVRAPSSRPTSTSAERRMVRVPLAPFTLSWSAAMVTSTPAGSGTGLLATRDMA